MCQKYFVMNKLLKFDEGLLENEMITKLRKETKNDIGKRNF